MEFFISVLNTLDVIAGPLGVSLFMVYVVGVVLS
jgi:hypothetical protein